MLRQHPRERVGRVQTMWLFTGRYSDFGAAICLIALGVVATGVTFIVLTARLVRRADVSPARAAVIIVALAAAAAFSEVKAVGEPVFVSDSLNRGAALVLAIVGIVLGVVGAIVSSKRRLMGILLLVIASGMLFGDVVGWIRRSAYPSKFDDPVGEERLQRPQLSVPRNSIGPTRSSTVEEIV
jgi:hypothetical protein